LKPALAFVIFFDDPGIDLSALAAAIQEKDHCVCAHAFARAQHHPPVVDGVFFQEQDFNLSTAAGLDSTESGRDDSRIVQNENIADAQVLDKVTKTSVRDAAIGAAQHQQSRLIALCGRSLSDQFGRQGVIEVSRAHDSMCNDSTAGSQESVTIPASWQAHSKFFCVAMLRNVNNL